MRRVALVYEAHSVQRLKAWIANIDDAKNLKEVKNDSAKLDYMLKHGTNTYSELNSVIIYQRPVSITPLSPRKNALE